MDENEEQPKEARREITQSLKVDLTDEELLDAGSEVAKAMTEKERLEDDLDRIKQQFKGDISRCDSIIQQNKALLQNKYEFRPVKCVEVRNFEDGTFTVYRTDTDEVVTNRRLRPDEMQMTLC